MTDIAMYVDIELEIDELEEIEFELDDVIIAAGDLLPYYLGPYTAIPKIKEQKLLTKDKSMKDDVTVTEIPYSETDNPYGGKTIVIGGEL